MTPAQLMDSLVKEYNVPVKKQVIINFRYHTPIFNQSTFCYHIIYIDYEYLLYNSPYRCNYSPTFDWPTPSRPIKRDYSAYMPDYRPSPFQVANFALSLIINLLYVYHFITNSLFVLAAFSMLLVYVYGYIYIFITQFQYTPT